LKLRDLKARSNVSFTPDCVAKLFAALREPQLSNPTDRRFESMLRACARP
jgi:hypothetical protein